MKKSPCEDCKQEEENPWPAARGIVTGTTPPWARGRRPSSWGNGSEGSTDHGSLPSALSGAVTDTPFYDRRARSSSPAAGWFGMD